ncbi:hypothetical protein [Spongiibacter tropicus]|uniref:hypothetical protein n=1 Tax=Spongiibacter tropicus TaxID=454602 RepID=UPI0024E230C5|nr:hypothetical protein [Spongiibacter tropicus]
MILHDTTGRPYRELIKTLHFLLRKRGAAISLSQTHEAFARSQGFSRKSSFDKAEFPLWVNETYDASDIFLDRASQLCKTPAPDRDNLLGKAASKVSRFPIIAPYSYSVEFSVDWDDGEIYPPNLRHESNNGRNLDEYYGHSCRFDLPYAITESEFERLTKELAPLIRRVVAGYSYRGYETMAEFSDDALKALDTIQRTLEFFDFQESYNQVEREITHFRDVGIKPKDIYELGLVDLYTDDLVPPISWQDSDSKIANFVALHILESPWFPINGLDLFEYFSELRDACRENMDELKTT